MDVSGTVTVRRVRSDDVDVYRHVRLRALQDAPSAFASTYASEAGRSRDEWSARVSAAASGVERATFLAFDGDTCVGVAGCGPDDRGADLQLVSMWVAPSHRGSGLGMALVRVVDAWAAEAGARWIALWVARDNDRARRLYERAGFVVTGEVQPLPSDPHREEFRMMRRVGLA